VHQLNYLTKIVTRDRIGEPMHRTVEFGGLQRRCEEAIRRTHDKHPNQEELHLQWSKWVLLEAGPCKACVHLHAKRIHSGVGLMCERRVRAVDLVATTLVGIDLTESIDKVSEKIRDKLKDTNITCYKFQK
jgi:hypothetical protein